MLFVSCNVLERHDRHEDETQLSERIAITFIPPDPSAITKRLDPAGSALGIWASPAAAAGVAKRHDCYDGQHRIALTDATLQRRTRRMADRDPCRVRTPACSTFEPTRTTTPLSCTRPAGLETDNRMPLCEALSMNTPASSPSPFPNRRPARYENYSGLMSIQTSSECSRDRHLPQYRTQGHWRAVSAGRPGPKAGCEEARSRKSMVA